MSEFESLLNSLHAGGELDSEGVFTIDMEQAMQKMAQFALPHPALGVLKLVQSGVAAGAGRIEVEVSRSLVQVKHDGKAPTESQLKNLFSYLFRKPTEKDKPLRDLAVAVSHALGHQVAGVEVSIEGYCQRWKTHQEVDTEDSPSTGNTLIRFTKGLKKVVKEFLDTPIPGPWSKPSLSEKSLVTDHCRCAPCTILLNDEEVTGSGKEQPVVLLVTLPEPGTPQFRAHPAAKTCHIVARGLEDGRLIFGADSLIRPGPHPGRLLASIAYQGDRGPLEVVFNQDGVDLEVRALGEQLKGPTTQARVVADGLPRDASDLRLVEGERLERRFTVIQRLTEQLSQRIDLEVP